MPDKFWKVHERKISKFFGGQRNPLSGSRSGHTAGDVIHPTLYVEVKSRKKFAVLELWKDTQEKAKKEGKIPIVALCEKNKKGFWILIKDEDYFKKELWNIARR